MSGKAILRTSPGKWFAGFGGGIYTDGFRTSEQANLELTKSTVRGNSANDGGGIYNALGTQTLTDSTMSGNLSSSGFGGGGIYNYFGGDTIGQSTLTLSNTIVGRNAALGHPDVNGTLDTWATTSSATPQVP